MTLYTTGYRALLKVAFDAKDFSEMSRIMNDEESNLAIGTNAVGTGVLVAGAPSNARHILGLTRADTDVPSKGVMDSLKRYVDPDVLPTNLLTRAAEGGDDAVFELAEYAGEASGAARPRQQAMAVQQAFSDLPDHIRRNKFMTALRLAGVAGGTVAAANLAKGIKERVSGEPKGITRGHVATGLGALGVAGATAGGLYAAGQHGMLPSFRPSSP